MGGALARTGALEVARTTARTVARRAGGARAHAVEPVAAIRARPAPVQGGGGARAAAAAAYASAGEDVTRPLVDLYA